MSIPIAYALIGLIMAIGLISDRWERLNFRFRYTTDLVVFILSGLYVMALWPTLLRKQNMVDDK